jgi:NAD(P)-dependent dehydrogenase (short-subunit alcohol dehydrogenase family)
MNENRVAVITGATGGTGRVVAKDLAEQGISLALFSTDQNRLADLAAELELPPEHYLAKALNLRSSEAAQTAAALVMEKFGRVDMLLHFVGGWTGGKKVVDFEIEAFRDMLQQHLWTTLHITRAFIPHLTANGWGRVIVISSPTAERPPAKSAPYAIAKAAQEALMLTLAQELKGSGVTANVLRVKTIDVKHQKDQEPTTTNAMWTTPEEITTAINYLISEEGGMVNGARLPLFGSP